jgi:hypothetical protein
VRSESTECYAISLVVRIRTPPSPHPQTSVFPPPLVQGEGYTVHTHLRDGGGVPVLTRGQTLWYYRYICTLCPYGYHLLNMFNEIKLKGLQSRDIDPLKSIRAIRMQTGRGGWSSSWTDTRTWQASSTAARTHRWRKLYVQFVLERFIPTKLVFQVDAAIMMLHFTWLLYRPPL